MADNRVDPYSPARPEHVRSRKRQVERERKAVIDAFGWVMDDARGRLVVRDIIVGAGFYEQSFGGDPYSTAYRCGRQSAAQMLVDFLEKEYPREFLLLETERLQAKIETQISDAAARVQATNQSADQPASEEETR